MNRINTNKRTLWIIIAFFSLMGYSLEAHAAVNEVKGPYSAIRPLVQIYADSDKATDGINAQAQPAKGTLQTNNIEIHYQWQPHNSLSVSKIQFYSSAPGKAYVRLYEATAGKPGKLLAEASFKSNTTGWQGIAFAQPVEVNANQTYYLSYAHEKDIKDYVTTEPNSQAVPFYWNDYNFTEETGETAEILEAPVLTRVKAYEAQIKLEWNAPGNQAASISYEVYRNGVVIGVTPHTYYIDQWAVKPEEGVFTYSIRTVKSDKLKSAFSNALSVTFQAEAVDDDDSLTEEPAKSSDEPSEPIQSPQPTPQGNDGDLGGGPVNSAEPEPTMAPSSTPEPTAIPDNHPEPAPTSTPAPAVVPDQESENSTASLTMLLTVGIQAAHANTKPSSHDSEQTIWTAVNLSVSSGPAPPAQRMPTISSKRRALAKSTAPLKLSKSAAAELPTRQGKEVKK